MGMEFGGRRHEGSDRASEQWDSRHEGSDRASEQWDSRVERPLTGRKQIEEITGREHVHGSKGGAPSEFTTWQFNPRLMEGIENRGYGGIESTKLTPCSVSDTTGWTPEQVMARFAEIKVLIGLPSTSEHVNGWWKAFEQEKQDRPELLLRIAEEIGKRSETVDRFFKAYCRSGTDNIQGNLDYLDYQL